MYVSVMSVISIGLFAIGLVLLHVALDLWHRHIKSLRRRAVDISIGALLTVVSGLSFVAAIVILLATLGVLPSRVYADAILYYSYLLSVGVFTVFVVCFFALTMLCVWPLYAPHRTILLRTVNVRRLAKRQARNNERSAKQ